MPHLNLCLKLLAPVFLVVGGLHLCLGLAAENLLGANLPIEVLTNATLDSQNRFYGVAFTLYGILLWLCASDLPKYSTVLRRILAVSFASGLARVLSMVMLGLPSPMVMALLTSELLLPPLLWLWMKRVV